MCLFRIQPFFDKGLRLAILVCLATLLGRTLLWPAAKNPSAKPAPTPAANQSPENPAPAQEESEALDKALGSARGDPQTLIRNLEEFLARFPKSPRREQVLQTIFQQAQQSNDPRKAAEYAEKLLALHPEDPTLLSTLVELLDRETDPARRARVIDFGARFVERAEKLAREPRPPEVPADKWRETQILILATAYLARGKVYAKSGRSKEATADYEKSFAAYPTAQVAERLGDLAAKNGDAERAIEYYTTGFAFPEKRVDPIRRDQLRRKLSSLYLAKHQSQKGLGDLILSRYDELVGSLHSRFEAQGTPNADVRDPFDYVLQSLDGSELRLAGFRGKVVVMDFWATWCAPCRVEGKLFEKVMQSFRSEPTAAFLAVNVDEDRSSVPAYVKEEQWTVPVVYAQGLDQLLGVRALPTVMIFDREGRVAFRQVGLDFSSFTVTLEKKVREALARGTSSSASSP